jgi:hypothetical protein
MAQQPPQQPTALDFQIPPAASSGYDSSPFIIISLLLQ